MGQKGVWWKMSYTDEGAGMKGLGNTGIKLAIEAVLGSKPYQHN